MPIEKLNNIKLRRLFDLRKTKLPSETNARRHLSVLSDVHKFFFRNYFKDKKIFLVVDESKIKNSKYLSILCGVI